MIIVTGGAGFIGSAVVWKLNQQGLEDILIVDALDRSDKWKNLVNRRYADYLDRRDFWDCLENHVLVSQLEAVIHMGACSDTTEPDSAYLMENNYRYTRRLAEWCLENNVRFIYASSGATYGDGAAGYSDDDQTTLGLKPLNMYGYSKQLLDWWALKSGNLGRLAGLKFFNVFGPNEYHKGDMRSVVHKAFGQIRESGRVQLFKSHRPDYADGQQVRDFVYVKDVVEVIWWLLQHPEVNGLFNIGTGQARSWNDLTQAVFAALEKPMQIDYVDMPEHLRDRYQYHTQADIGKLQRAGYPGTFRTLEEAVLDYVKKYLLQPDSYLE